MRALVLALCLVSLSACKTFEERRQAAIMDARQQCFDFGFSPDTPAMAECVRQTYIAPPTTSEALQKFSADMERAQQQYHGNYGNRQPIQPLNCTSRTFGNSTRTTCF